MNSHESNAGPVKLNGAIDRILKDHSLHAQLESDWQQAALTELDLNPEQETFIRALPPRSVETIQDVVRNVIKTDGKVYFKLDEHGDAELLAEHSPINGDPVDPLRIFKLVICKFDANFRNCKWFWQK